LNEGGVISPDKYNGGRAEEIETLIKGGYLKGTYVETKRPKNIREGKDVDVRVTPKSRSGNVSFKLNVDNKYIKSVSGQAEGGKSTTKVDVAFKKDPVFQQTIKFIHGNAAIQLGLDPKKMPLNISNIRTAYGRYKGVFKDTKGREDRQYGTGYKMGATFEWKPEYGWLDIDFKKTPQREKTIFGRLRYKF
jgi:uncharacterized protein YggU (UPF0235/DUF167 family)